jgi:hypothetical protein
MQIKILASFEREAPSLVLRSPATAAAGTHCDHERTHMAANREQEHALIPLSTYVGNEHTPIGRACMKACWPFSARVRSSLFALLFSGKASLVATPC